MPSKRKRGNAYELRASCGFNAKGRRVMKTRTWRPPYGMTEAQAEKEATRQAFLFEEEIRRGEVLDQSTKMEDFLVKWLHNYAENSSARPRLRAINPCFRGLTRHSGR